MHRFASASRQRRGWFVLAVASTILANCADPTTANNGVAEDPTAPAKAAAAPSRTSTINVTISGLPAGVAAAIAVSGPGGFSRALTTTTQLTGLNNGTYTFTASNVVSGGKTYAPSPIARSVSVSKGSTGTATFAYSEVVTTGALTVNISMPDATPAAVVVTGPSGFTRALTSTQTLSTLVPGTYTVTASDVPTSGGAVMKPAPASQVVTVTVGTTASATVAYSAVVTTGALTVNISMPGATPAAVVVTGPSGFTRTLTSTQTLSALVPGTYTVTASNVTTSGGAVMKPTPASQVVTVTVAATANATVAYSELVTTGALAVSISMPDATPAAVVVTGPSGFTRALTSTQTLFALAPGSYTVTASNVTGSGGVVMKPAPVSQVVTVAVSATATATVAYTATTVEPGPTLNLQITNMYLTQSVQTLAGGVPLVAGRNGVLRVFALANGSNTVQPVVRARVYRNGVLMNTLTAAAAQSSVPTTLNESSATASWNFAVAGSLIQGGMSILVDVDPSNLIPESSDTDNQFPASGTPQTFDVRTVPALNVVFVPLKQNATGLMGDVSAANSETFLARTRDMHPLNVVTSSVRAPYTTSYTVGSDGANWGAVLSELRSVKAADGSSANYYGLLKVGYGSGVAGMGYIGSGTAIGWDHLPSGSEIMAHELGHNFGRNHAPCGGVSGADGAFPYAGGAIGVFGYNVRLGQLLQPSTSDLMGYCSPTWISDYTYKAVLNFRGNSVASTTTSASVQPGLLVWGRVTTDGTIILEPATHIDARSVMPARSGAYTLQGTDESGKSVFSFSFDPEQVADETGTGERHFAFVVPMSETTQDQLSTLSVRGQGKSAARTSRRTIASLEDAVATASLDDDGAGKARLRWNAAEQPMVVVRDVNTGAILSFARGGNSAFAAPGTDVELVISDGVRSVTQRKKVRGR